MADPIVALIDVLDSIKKVLAVLVVFEDWFLFITARGNVVNCASIFYAKWAGQDGTAAQDRVICNEKDLIL